MIMEPDIYTSITELAAVYETLNESLESDPCTTDVYQVCCQQTYRDAYAALQAMPVEPIALRLIAEGISDRVLTRLRDLIRKNIHICETRKEFFRQVCSGDLCRLQEDYLFAGKRTSLLNDRKEIEEYPYPTHRECISGTIPTYCLNRKAVARAVAPYPPPDRTDMKPPIPFPLLSLLIWSG